MTLEGQRIDTWGAYPLTLEGRPLRTFPWRDNGLRAFFGHANRVLTAFITFIYKPSGFNQRLAKKTATRPKLARSMTGRRRGETPLLDPTRPQAASHPPRGYAPRPRCGLTPRMERLRRCGLGKPGASAWRKAISSRACEGAKPPHTPQLGPASSTACAILKRRGGSTVAGFTPRKGVGRAGRWSWNAPQVSKKRETRGQARADHKPSSE